MLHGDVLMADIDVDQWRNAQNLVLRSAKEAKRLSRGLGIGDDRVSVVVQERVGPVDEHVQVFVGGPGVLEGREVFVGRIALKDEHEIGSCRVCLVERTGGL